jgi:hypothetical protein
VCAGTKNKEKEKNMSNTNPKTQSPIQNPIVQGAVESWNKLVADQMERLQSLTQELERHSQQGIEQANAAIDEMSRMMKDSLAQTAKLSAEWRKLAMEATRRAGETLGSMLGQA